MKIYEGPSTIAEKSNARILPVRIDGALYTPFTRAKGKVATKWFPQITITILPHREFNIDPRFNQQGKTPPRQYEAI